MIRSFSAREFPVRVLVELKRGRRISVCMPARDEEKTVAERDRRREHPPGPDDDPAAPGGEAVRKKRARPLVARGRR